MKVFVDTSALYALLDHDDAEHLKAAAAWQWLLEQDPHLLSSNYVLVESAALIQRRMGMAAFRDLHDNLALMVEVLAVELEEHWRAVAAVLAANRTKLSLVDCTSFEVMRRLGISHAFAFDPHFAEQGFKLIPG